MVIGRVLIYAAVPLLCSNGAFAQAIQIIKDDQLRAAPLPTAPLRASVKAGAKGDMLMRKGFWMQVRLPAGEGWIKLSSVQLSKATISGLAALNSGRGATGNIVNSSGTRGLTPEDLAEAPPSEAELKMLQANQVSAQQVQQFRQRSGLVARSMPYLAKKGETATPNRAPTHSDTQKEEW